MEYEALSVIELRNLVTQRKIGNAGWRVVAKKAELVVALETGVGPTNASSSTVSHTDLAVTIAAAIAQHIPPSLDEERVQEMIDAAMSDRPNNKLEVRYNENPPVILDKQHKCFPQLLHRLKCRTHVWLVGPAGSGKTTAAENAAKALSLDYDHTGAIDTEYKLMGFIDAQGRYVSKAFRRIYEHGGVFLFDEIDASFPAAVLAFNAALANGHANFPDATVKRHKDFVCVAAANTWQGPSAEYNGRTKQDAATLDRFARQTWGYDEELETAVVRANYPTQMKWVSFVQSVRANCLKHGIQHVVSPRASFEGAKSQANGGIWADDVSDFIRKGLNDATWAKVSGDED